MENTEKVVYVDNAATTACAPEVLEVMVQALSGACGNPSSHYSIGYEAKEFVDTGRAQVAKAINATPAEIFFTGCGSALRLRSAYCPAAAPRPTTGR